MVENCDLLKSVPCKNSFPSSFHAGALHLHLTSSFTPHNHRWFLFNLLFGVLHYLPLAPRRDQAALGPRVQKMFWSKGQMRTSDPRVGRFPHGECCPWKQTISNSAIQHAHCRPLVTKNFTYRMSSLESRISILITQ